MKRAMAGKATNAGEDDLDLPSGAEEEDDGEAAESTVAMASPTFEHSSGMPLPISNPPPGMGGGPPLHMPPTAPVPFVPQAKTPAPPPPKPGAIGASPFGMGAAPPKRAQTVIGIAPPAAGAQKPPTPAAPLPPIAPKVPTNPGSTARVAPAQIARSTPKVPAAEDGPTVMGQSADPMFGLDEAAGDAARAAALGPGRAPRSPLATTGYAGPSAPKPPSLPRPPPPVDEVATVAVPKDDLDRARAASGPLSFGESQETEDESTRAVPRDELLRQGSYVVGEEGDAGGEDATLAVAPGANPGANAALAATVVGEEAAPAFPPVPPSFQQQQPHQPPPPSWNQPGPTSAPFGGATLHHQQPPMMHGQGQPGSNPQMPVSGPNPNMPTYGGPHQQQQQQHLPQSGHMPVSQPGYGMGAPMSNPIPYSGHMMPGGQQPMMQPQNQGGFSWPGGGKLKLSNQIILLAIVGVICLAIFITGIVLFATTKF